tara:strand:+ start:4703 stop:5836 length:1134 start_codon:yes stop_codon:yes gene_type:complete
MALNQVGLERLGTQVSKKIGASKNLIINGAFQVAQRGTSSTSTGYQTVDRVTVLTNGVDEQPTQAQVDVASGTEPYTNGFRKAFKLTNGNQTSGAGAADFIVVRHKIESQNVANSGWDYTSTSSNITLSFWIKASVAQNYFFSVLSSDGTLQNFPMETGSLSADTWTKITKIIPGAANVQFDNDNGIGIELDWWPFAGTSYTASGVALNTWAAFASGTRFPDHTSTWYTTNDATLEITGVQLEVGSVATDFEHKSFAQELALCQRYCQVLGGNRTQELLMHGTYNGTGTVTGFYEAVVQFRVKPSFSISNVAHVNCFGFNSVDSGSPTAMSLINAMSDKHWIYIDSNLSSTSGTGGLTVMVRANSTTACKFTLDAEL